MHRTMSKSYPKSLYKPLFHSFCATSRDIAGRGAIRTPQSQHVSKGKCCCPKPNEPPPEVPGKPRIPIEPSMKRIYSLPQPLKSSVIPLFIQLVNQPVLVIPTPAPPIWRTR